MHDVQQRVCCLCIVHVQELIFCDQVVELVGVLL